MPQYQFACQECKKESSVTLTLAESIRFPRPEFALSEFRTSTGRIRFTNDASPEAINPYTPNDKYHKGWEVPNELKRDWFNLQAGYLQIETVVSPPPVASHFESGL